jgi:hypothetical protein
MYNEINSTDVTNGNQLETCFHEMGTDFQNETVVTSLIQNFLSAEVKKTYFIHRNIDRISANTF